MSAYYATPGEAPLPIATEQEQLAPVLIAFAGPAPQSRLTVAFRLILAIPQFIVVWALTIAAEVLAIIGWFAALFIGRLPGFVADFLSGFLRWQTRVFGYAILLTDVYPPFSLEDADYPIPGRGAAGAAEPARGAVQDLPGDPRRDRPDRGGLRWRSPSCRS